jgi:hypothetical protein
MLRLLIRDITVTKGQEPKLLRLNIRWQGGAIETIELQLIARLRELHKKCHRRAVAD